jgi:hypothetical protein
MEQKAETVKNKEEIKYRGQEIGNTFEFLTIR